MSELRIGEIVGAIGIIVTLFKVFDFYHKSMASIESILKRVEKLEECAEDENLMKTATQAMLHDRLIDLYQTFKERGKMSMIDRQRIDSVYKSYKAFGGNGALEQYYEELMKLPTEVVK